MGLRVCHTQANAARRRSNDRSCFIQLWALRNCHERTQDISFRCSNELIICEKKTILHANDGLSDTGGKTHETGALNTLFIVVELAVRRFTNCSKKTEWFDFIFVCNRLCPLLAH